MPIHGLTAAEVESRRAAGLTNCPPRSPTKTTGEIVRDNICTYFNLVFLVLALMLLSVGSWLNMGFLGIVFWNTLIGIIQQLRAKKTIDELTLVSAHKVRCLRDGQWVELLSDELVQDDVVEIRAGEQIAADAVVLDGTAQANESLLTGEARPIAKNPGDELRSGSFLAAGHCVARLTKVGAESYAAKLATEAKADGHKVVKGEMMRSLDKLIRAIGIALVPIGAALLYKQHWQLGVAMRGSVETTVAALIGMIPEGLYLLTSVALAVGMMRLARRRVLTQDMNCIETLARVDVLCVDKTGTITESTMQADEPVLLNENAPVTDILTTFYSGEEPDNDTARALCEKFGQGGSPWFAARSIPFNTAYKYSAKSFGAQGSYVVGAPDILAGARLAELRPVLDPLLAQGRRVLLLARCKGELPDPPARLDPDTLEFLALLPLQNRIRESAPETFAYFARQGVDVKVISGDDPRVVSHVAAQAGIRGADQWVERGSPEKRPRVGKSRRPLHGIWPCNAGAKAQAGTRPAKAGTYSGHDRRWRKRRSGVERCRLRHCHGIGCAGRQPGGTAGAAGFGLRCAAPCSGRRTPGHQQHPAVGVAVFGQKHLLGAAQRRIAGAAADLSVFAAAAVAARRRNHRYASVFSGAGAEPRAGARAVYLQRAAGGAARRHNGFFTGIFGAGVLLCL